MFWGFIPYFSYVVCSPENLAESYLIVFLTTILVMHYALKQGYIPSLPPSLPRSCYWSHCLVTRKSFERFYIFHPCLTSTRMLINIPWRKQLLMLWIYYVQDLTIGCCMYKMIIMIHPPKLLTLQCVLVIDAHFGLLYIHYINLVLLIPMHSTNSQIYVSPCFI